MARRRGCRAHHITAKLCGLSHTRAHAFTATPHGRQAFIASLLIISSTTICLFVNVVPRILSLEEEVLRALPKLQQMLDERQGLLGDDAEGVVAAARVCLVTALQIARHNLFLPVGVGIGAAVGPMLAVRGILRTMKTYTHTYDLLWTHGPTAMRFPLRRANSVRFFATFIAFQLCGFVLVVLLFAAASIVLVLLWEGDWPGAPLLRALVLTVVSMQMMEMLIIRSVVVPLCQKLQCGPALFMLELWYLTSGFIKGFTRLSNTLWRRQRRLESPTHQPRPVRPAAHKSTHSHSHFTPAAVLLWFIPLMTFFTPAKCAFVDGMESWDSGHLTFVCYVMTRVCMPCACEREDTPRLRLTPPKPSRMTLDTPRAVPTARTHRCFTRRASLTGGARQAAPPGQAGACQGGAADPPPLRQAHSHCRGDGQALPAAHAQAELAAARCQGHRLPPPHPRQHRRHEDASLNELRRTPAIIGLFARRRRRGRRQGAKRIQPLAWRRCGRWRGKCRGHAHRKCRSAGTQAVGRLA